MIQQKVTAMLLISYQDLSHSQFFLLQVRLKELCNLSLPVQNTLGSSAVNGSNLQFVNMFPMNSFSSFSKFLESQVGFDWGYCHLYVPLLKCSVIRSLDTDENLSPEILLPNPWSFNSWYANGFVVMGLIRLITGDVGNSNILHNFVDRMQILS